MKTDNPSSDDHITIDFTGQFVVSRTVLKSLMVSAPPNPTLPTQGRERNVIPDDGGKLPRLAYSPKETAEILGVSPVTIYRLLQRGLLRSSQATRHKVIPKKEIERFLATTISDEWSADPLG